MSKINTETAEGLEAIIELADGSTANMFWMQTGVKPCELITLLARELKLVREEKEANE